MISRQGGALLKPKQIRTVVNQVRIHFHSVIENQNQRLNKMVEADYRFPKKTLRNLKGHKAQLYALFNALRAPNKRVVRLDLDGRILSLQTEIIAKTNSLVAYANKLHGPVPMFDVVLHREIERWVILVRQLRDFRARKASQRVVNNYLNSFLRESDGNWKQIFAFVEKNSASKVSSTRRQLVGTEAA